MKNRNILFIAHHKWPHIGGVERHIEGIANRLQGTDNKVTTVSEEDIKPPHTKILGLIYIWFWLFKNRHLIATSDVVHIHDVFIWYIPFRFIFPKKKVYITFHGWEGKWPLPMWAILNKRIANFLCNGSIAVGIYIEKWYGIKATYTTYGGVDIRCMIKDVRKTKKTIVFLGRQDNDTGIKEFKEWLLKQEVKYSVKYITNSLYPEKYLKTAEYCVPSGYLSYLEAKSFGCKILTFPNNPLKIDYWKEIQNINKIPTWSEVADIYIKLWQNN